jgi:hypothetical protein
MLISVYSPCPSPSQMQLRSSLSRNRRGALRLSLSVSDVTAFSEFEARTESGIGYVLSSTSGIFER